METGVNKQKRLKHNKQVWERFANDFSKGKEYEVKGPEGMKTTVFEFLSSDPYARSLAVKISNPTTNTILALRMFSFSKAISFLDEERLIHKAVEKAEDDMRLDSKEMAMLGWGRVSDRWEKEFESFRLIAAYHELVSQGKTELTAQVELMVPDSGMSQTILVWRSQKRLPLAVASVEMFGNLPTSIWERPLSNETREWCVKNEVSGGMVYEFLKNQRLGVVIDTNMRLV